MGVPLKYPKEQWDRQEGIIGAFLQVSRGYLSSKSILNVAKGAVP
jgi:hypothetical protein